ncbi:hypothetical protein Patl1_18382 [Pistacia atlantica]|uniref:Uncharacterized protein n=1 Tax=Pistacia atlantica TaxID=434234 RepID=A0ACC1BYQ2_9ROSI|nr:hypothetical protein Patl1_18382 [Pistacia atlantica]
MGSQVLPQVMYMIPINSSQSLPSKKLGFSTVLSLGSYSGHRVSVSKVSARPVGWNLGLFVNAPMRGDFAVRAESNEVEASESVEVKERDVVEAEGDGEEAEAETDAEEEVKTPRKPIVKLGDIMGILNKRAVEASEKERPIPDIRTGDIIEIKLEVPENRRRLSIYKGIVMSRQNAGIHTTIRIRRIIAGIGVEIVFPL